MLNNWFPASDELEENGHFTAHLTLTTHFDLDGQTYKAHEGFVEWMEGLRKKLVPGTIKHKVESLSVVKGAKSAHKAIMTLNVKAMTVDGAAIDKTTQEEWSLDLTNERKVILVERLSRTL